MPIFRGLGIEVVEEGSIARKRRGDCRKTYMLNESTLVLEGVTLAEMVQLVVEMLVNFAGSAIFDQKATEDAETAHPHHLAVFQALVISMDP